ncbi:phosphate ABC transporter permease subunit PstC [Halorubellus sp. JP-L1]|uniref:phosphate ABC transporter permease subunit PstC n=1 Tax=Halorubellus sp. JP-L1 TaxID=2715753 RepID=UPI00140DA2E9|nr:phosphate ABC transporter permease subunit PstC [Halorubellus sp. JP-L1]NHN41135.1 phosphate ABC transporter permease subunit PstC [Halorubellus sp. JP-L1]
MSRDLTSNVRTTLLGRDASEGALLSVGLTALLLVATVGVFLVAPAYALPTLLAFVLVTTVAWVRNQAETARLLTLVATVSTVLTVSFITIYLFASAFPAVVERGASLFVLPVENGRTRWFFWLDALLPSSGTVWNPLSGAYSLIPTIWATVIVTTISAFVAGPLGLFGALFISEVASDGVREVVKPAVEVLAGIPSIVYGFIGFQVLNGFVQASFLDDGASFLIAGLVVGIMALPTVVSVAEDSLSSVPRSMKDGSVAMGATQWQTMKSISIPAAFSGISAGLILGLGRAVGETMAVAAIMAAGVGLANPLFDVFDQGATLTSLIATNYGSASESTLGVLFVAGVILFVIVAGMSVLSQYVERRMNEKLRGDA